MTRNQIFRYSHLILLPVYFVLHHYYVNFKGVSAADSAELMLVHLPVIALLLGIFYFFTRNFSRAALYTTVLMLFSLFFGLIKDFIFSRISLAPALQYLSMVGSIALVIWILHMLIARKKAKENDLHILLTLLFLLWIGVELFQSIGLRKKASTFFNPVSFSPVTTKEKPSIYVLVLDEYPRKDALKTIFGYDNSRFLNELTNRGFVIDSQSRSNYELSLFSMSATFSLDYLPFTGAPLNEDYSIAGWRLNKAPLWTLLKNEGYSLFNYSIFTIDDIPPFPNSYTRHYHWEYFTRTLPGRFIEDFPSLFYSSERRKSKREKTAYKDRTYNEYRLKDLQSHKPPKQPEFAYIHLMMPHPPFFMDSSGKAIDVINNEEAGNFVDYLIYSNKITLSVIDKLQQLPGEKIIYIIGDHGFRSDETPRELFFHNLSAIYATPAVKVQQGLTNINQFRSILNQALQQNLPVIKDTSIHATFGRGHFDF